MVQAVSLAVELHCKVVETLILEAHWLSTRWVRLSIPWNLVVRSDSTD